MSQFGDHRFDTSDPTRTVWDVEFGVRKWAWTPEEFQFSVSTWDVSNAPVDARDIPNVTEVSTEIFNLWGSQ